MRWGKSSISWGGFTSPFVALSLTYPSNALFSSTAISHLKPSALLKSFEGSVFSVDSLDDDDADDDYEDEEVMGEMGAKRPISKQNKTRSGHVSDASELHTVSSENGQDSSMRSRSR